MESTGTISNVFAVTAKSGYWQDIKNAVDQVAAAGGGSVYIPAGTFNFVNTGESWTGARVTIPAGVNVIGSYSVNGDDVTWNTMLRLPSSVGGDPYGTWTGTVKSTPTLFKIEGDGSSGESSMFAGLKLVGYRSIDSSDHLQVKALSVASVIDYRVCYCYFEHMTGGGVSASGKYCRGVVDHCWFINHYATVTSMIETCDVGYGCSFFRSFTEDLWEPITEVLGKYTLYSHFVEDCTLSKWRHEFAANDGAHYVARYNKIGPTYGFQIIDAHGTYNVVGTRAIEVYNNSFIENLPYSVPKSIVGWRGGAGVFFDNTFDSSFSFPVIMLCAEGTVEKCWAHDVYIWNSDTCPISYTSSQQTGSDGLLHPAPNIDFFTYKPAGYTPYPYPHPLTLE
ncbi:hypothetical protein JXA31_01390 [Candidatus Bathyarchaeota archaeon]|nr:hypothetical protein [Candidatus Bathyarchaeota archaeon]